jgi:hypothetical protein
MNAAAQDAASPIAWIDPAQAFGLRIGFVKASRDSRGG